jgi:hypothetical protein
VLIREPTILRFLALALKKIMKWLAVEANGFHSSGETLSSKRQIVGCDNVKHIIKETIAGG